MVDYTKNVVHWDQVFAKKEPVTVQSTTVGNEQLDHALDWLCLNSSSVLDFGCGNGACLFKCSLRGTTEHIGIDLSTEAIKLAQQSSSSSQTAQFRFLVGGVAELEKLEPQSVDAVILFNIIDNLHPTDATAVLAAVTKILRPQGKALVKLNAYLTPDEIRQYGIKQIEGSFLDDGLYLWNQSTEEWKALLAQYLHIIDYSDVYFPAYDQCNRLFRLMKGVN